MGEGKRNIADGQRAARLAWGMADKARPGMLVR